MMLLLNPNVIRVLQIFAFIAITRTCAKKPLPRGHGTLSGLVRNHSKRDLTHVIIPDERAEGMESMNLPLNNYHVKTASTMLLSSNLQPIPITEQNFACETALQGRAYTTNSWFDIDFELAVFIGQNWTVFNLVHAYLISVLVLPSCDIDDIRTDNDIQGVDLIDIDDMGGTCYNVAENATRTNDICIRMEATAKIFLSEDTEINLDSLENKINAAFDPSISPPSRIFYIYGRVRRPRSDGIKGERYDDSITSKTTGADLSHNRNSSSNSDNCEGSSQDSVDGDKNSQASEVKQLTDRNPQGLSRVGIFVLSFVPIFFALSTVFYLHRRRQRNQLAQRKYVLNESDEHEANILRFGNTEVLETWSVSPDNKILAFRDDSGEAWSIQLSDSISTRHGLSSIAEVYSPSSMSQTFYPPRPMSDDA